MPLNSPFLRSLYPPSTVIFPANLIFEDDGRLLGSGSNKAYRTQGIQCSYPISGGYGPTARYIFYFLAIVAVVWHRESWVVLAALGSVMVYSSTAAIHALVLAGTRTRLLPESTLKNYEVVLVAGAASSTDSIWAPVLPMAWDNDADPVLAIVAVAFLLLLPMQIWSTTLRKIDTHSKSIVLAWALLLSAGLIAAIINEAYTIQYAFTQFRFCPMDREDPLPFTNPGFDQKIEPWDGTDYFRWNRTVYNHFIAKTNGSSHPVGLSCFYPCLGSRMPLREPGEITVLPYNFGEALDEDVGLGVLFAAIFCLSVVAASLLTVGLLTYIPAVEENWKPLSFRTSFWELCAACILPTTTLWGRTWRTVLRLWILWNLIVAKFLTPLIVVASIVMFEWVIWVGDPPGETFQHVGQWSVLVGAGLVILAAAVPLISEVMATCFSYLKTSSSGKTQVQQLPMYVKK